MTYSFLLEKALEERGNAILVISHPLDGVDAVIQAVNSCFSNIVNRSIDLLTGLRFGELRSLVAVEQDWQAVMNAMRTLSPLKLDLPLNVLGRQTWLGFDLTFTSDIQTNTDYGLLIGRDITEPRRRSRQESESQRLLASVFLRTSAPVVIVRSDGVILMSNPAFQDLIGYSANELTSLNVEALTAPNYAAVTQQAREQQFRTGGRMKLRIETIRKDGSYVPVSLTSVLLRDTQDLRVVTLLPYLADFEASPATSDDDTSHLLKTRDIGQVGAVSLAAFKNLLGDSWSRIESRATMMAEQILKRRLAPRDVFNRSDDGFVVWFDSQDQARNEEVLEKLVRDIRLRLLEEFSSEKALAVHANLM